MGGGSRNGNPVKVVIIDTQYVKTDAMSFKSVVQSLTGKHSAPIAAQQPPPMFYSGGSVSFHAPPVLSRGKSFKDIERMIMEFPTLDELHRLYCQDIF
ncbi:hypothetical protein ACS0TY_017175 [Phlomoides rotata]